MVGYIKSHTYINKINGYVYCNAGQVHRLVARAFFGNKEGFDVNHKDGNKQNNTISNLEWCTHKENMQHAFRTGLNNFIVQYDYKTKRKSRKVFNYSQNSSFANR